MSDSDSDIKTSAVSREVKNLGFGSGSTFTLPTSGTRVRTQVSFGSSKGDDSESSGQESEEESSDGEWEEGMKQRAQVCIFSCEIYYVLLIILLFCREITLTLISYSYIPLYLIYKPTHSPAVNPPMEVAANPNPNVNHNLVVSTEPKVFVVVNQVAVVVNPTLTPREVVAVHPTNSMLDQIQQ